MVVEVGQETPHLPMLVEVEVVEVEVQEDMLVVPVYNHLLNLEDMDAMGDLVMEVVEGLVRKRLPGV